MYDCGCNKNSSQSSRVYESSGSSPIYIDSQYENIPSMDEYSGYTQEYIGMDNCGKKDACIPIIVEPGNDVLITIKLRTTDDKQTIDIDANDIENLIIKLNDSEIPYYIDTDIKCLLHAKIPSELISETQKYDISVSGIWNGNNVKFTFYKKIIVTKKYKYQQTLSVMKNVSTHEDYIGSAIFIPSPSTYKTEEELREIINSYNEKISELEESMEELEKEREALSNITTTVLPNINEKVDDLHKTSAKEETLLKNSEEIKTLIEENSVIPSKRAFSRMKKINEYLYFIEYDDINWEEAREYFKSHILELSFGACTAIRKGNEIGRNYDWNYDKSVEFILSTKRHNGRYASAGIAGNVAKFTPETIGKYDEYYKYLPFRMLDGINECGVACNINMLNPDEKRTLPISGTVPVIEEREKLCSFMLCRFVLDSFETAKEAAEYIRNYVSIYPALVDGRPFDLHMAIYDKNNTFYISFEPDDSGIFRTMIKDMTDVDFAMTNFRLLWADEDIDGDGLYNRFSLKKHGDQLCIEKYGEGIERANLCLDFIRNTHTDKGVIDFMSDDIKYTNAYKDNGERTWFTEFVGKYSQEDLARYSQNHEFSRVLDIVRNDFAHRSRDPQEGYNPTWQTLHTSVYDLDEKTIKILTQESEAKTNIGTDESPILVDNSLFVKIY